VSVGGLPTAGSSSVPAAGNGSYHRVCKVLGFWMDCVKTLCVEIRGKGRGEVRGLGVCVRVLVCVCARGTESTGVSVCNLFGCV